MGMMKLRLLPLLSRNRSSLCRSSHQTVPSFLQTIHTSRTSPANPLPITAHGPPPGPPSSVACKDDDRFERRKPQTAILQSQMGSKDQKGFKSKISLKKRFWKEVSTREVPGQGYQVLLDKRALRTPSKSILVIPLTKSHLASAIALEWDLLVSADQALKQHMIPLTSLTCRADEIRRQDGKGMLKIRNDIVDMIMRYLDTDTLLCWAPERSPSDAAHLEDRSRTKRSLRDIQIHTARPIIAYLTSYVWPGVNLRPVLDTNSILPTPQSQNTTAVIRGWVTGLAPFELAAMERGVLAGKSLLIAARLVVEWSEMFHHLPKETKRFGIEEGAIASSLEVRWQTDIWGRVEDTHDVDKEDIRRQLGSVVLLVSGGEPLP